MVRDAKSGFERRASAARESAGAPPHGLEERRSQVPMPAYPSQPPAGTVQPRRLSAVERATISEKAPPPY